MDFDTDGSITTMGLIQLVELESQGRRNHETMLHNMDVSEITVLAEQIVRYCLTAISSNRTLLEQEGALNSRIKDYLTGAGYEVVKRDSSGKPYIHTREQGNTVITPVLIPNQNSDVIPDLIVSPQLNRVELKTAAMYTPKDRVPKSFYEKDIEHLCRLNPGLELDRGTWEGPEKEHREAELVLIAMDMDIARNNERFRETFGLPTQFSEEPMSSGLGYDYQIHKGTFASSETPRVSGRISEYASEFIVLVAYPSRQT